VYIATVSLVLLLNILLATIIATVWTIVEEILTMCKGYYRVARRTIIALHLLIDLLSRLLVGPSNYYIQRLVALTR
jgi:hypothetical protein